MQKGGGERSSEGKVKRQKKETGERRKGKGGTRERVRLRYKKEKVEQKKF